MVWIYKPTRDEIAAEKLLKSNGWQVSFPKCPECNGWGRKDSWRQYMGIPDYNKKGEQIGYHFPTGKELEEISPLCSYECEIPTFNFY